MCSHPTPRPAAVASVPAPRPGTPGSLGRSSRVGSGTQTSPSAGPARPSPAVQLTQGEGEPAGAQGSPDARAGAQSRTARRAPATPGDRNRGLLRPLEAKGWREQAGEPPPRALLSRPQAQPEGSPSTHVQRPPRGAPAGQDTGRGACPGQNPVPPHPPVPGFPSCIRAVGGAAAPWDAGKGPGAPGGAPGRSVPVTGAWGRQRPTCLARRGSSGSQSDRSVPLQAPSSSTQHSWAERRPQQTAWLWSRGAPREQQESGAWGLRAQGPLCRPQASLGKRQWREPQPSQTHGCAGPAHISMYRQRLPGRTDAQMAPGQGSPHRPHPCGWSGLQGRRASPPRGTASAPLPGRSMGLSTLHHHWTPSSSTYVEGNHPIRPLVSPFHQPWSPPMRL